MIGSLLAAVLQGERVDVFVYVFVFGLGRIEYTLIEPLGYALLSFAKMIEPSGAPEHIGSKESVTARSVRQLLLLVRDTIEQLACPRIATHDPEAQYLGPTQCTVLQGLTSVLRRCTNVPITYIACHVQVHITVSHTDHDVVDCTRWTPRSTPRRTPLRSTFHFHLVRSAIATSSPRLQIHVSSLIMQRSAPFDVRDAVTVTL